MAVPTAWEERVFRMLFIVLDCLVPVTQSLFDCQFKKATTFLESQPRYS